MSKSRRVFFLSEIVARLGGELRGEDVEIFEIAPLDQADRQSIAFLSNPKLRPQLQTTAAAAVIVKAADAAGLHCPCIVTPDPYLYFARVTALLHPQPAPVSGIHPSAIIAEDAFVDSGAEIGPQVVIESGVRIGARTVIKAGCVIGADTVIGEDCLFYPRVTVYHNTVIGNRVIIHAGAVIGSDGFGNAWARDHWEKIPQIGRAVVGDDVEIGANTTIDRGALGDTVIASGARLDNMIQIGHNVEIGRFTAIAACSGIAGSTKIGAGCLIGGGVGMSGHLKIADRVTILGGSNVPSSIDEPGVYGGSVTPIMPQGIWRRNAIHYRNLDQLVKRVKVLEKKLGATEEDTDKEEGDKL
ncbi:UDP-3-O-[3-hydroxymyristoyl] glucosamine N-acyltransferase [Formivibrio citricus]|uniref:UDP-3-O-acylglucosamine N-acyltransferase n=2 Tax=Formivibrio citricus TaxID=83765 RepID=A0A1I4XAI8_9NEIS|nr:UDP-3-O-[3-hydroxymyristoyl] glucosamine N-acyltransferase [Formivibrio citricus]